MSLPKNLNDREQDKFVEGPDGETRSRVAAIITQGFHSLISTENSSSSSLDSAASFIGSWVDITQYIDISVFTLTSQASTLEIHLSTDGSTVERTLSFSISANTGTPHKFARITKYFRVKLTNNSGSTSTVSLQTILSEYPKSHLTTNLSANINDYSDTEVVRAVLAGRHTSGNYRNVGIGDSGGIKIDAIKTAFGALTVAQVKPYINLHAIHGNPERFTEAYNNGTDSFASYIDNNPGKEFKVSTGTDLYGYGVLRSKKVLSYRPGIGSMCRFTARFTTPVAQSIQFAGLQNIGNELGFGYSGTSFGITHKTGGRPEIRKLTITQRATASQTVTLTLDSVAFNIAVTNTTIEQNAKEIAAGVTTWNSYAIGSDVYFEAKTVGVKSGTYSISSTGNLTGTIAQTYAGAAATTNFIAQSSWNADTLLTSSNSFILDQTKGNVYKIQYQYLGYGIIKFLAENPETGDMILVHTIKYPNANVTPSIDFPTFKLGIYAASAGSTTNLSVFSASLAGFIENTHEVPYKIHSASGGATSVTSTRTCLLALKKITIANDTYNISDILINNVSVGTEATKPGVLELVLNPVFGTSQTWQKIDEDLNMLSSTVGGTATNGEVIYSLAVSKSANTLLDISHYGITLSNDDTLAICYRTQSGNGDTMVGVTYTEI